MGLIAVLVGLASTAGAQVTAIRAGNLLDPAGGRALGPGIIVVEGSRIKAVGPGVAIPPGASVIDLSTSVVLPGLFDAHTHVAAGYDPALTRLREYTISVSTAERALQGVANAWQMLDAGFTTLRDLGNAGNYADAALASFFGGGDPRRRALYGAAAIDSVVLSGHPLVGPTIVYAGKIIAPFGGQFLNSPEQPDIGRQDYLYADTQDELRRAIRENLHYGATWIKLVVDDYPYQYSAADLAFAVSEAKAAGARVTVHAVTEKGARAAIEAGVASIEHGYEMSDEAIALAKARGIVLVGTEPAGAWTRRYGKSAQDGRIVDRLRRAYRAGLDLAFGADIVRAPPGTSRGAVALSVVDSWIEAGVPPADILRALTVNGARLLGMERDRGAIRAGFFADLIATRRNPLEDLAALKDVVFVMKEGKVFRSAAR
jgi:imidazolonepropionase-like amidohydrolase